MLKSLRIENIAVIKQAVLDFQNGFTVMTGETGAGKSIVIDSINAVLGERTSRELIRTGAKEASVCAEFSGISEETENVLREFDIESGETLILQRRLFADGRNSCRINGSPANVAMLKKLGATLLNIHGQSDNQALLQPENHCGFIDRLAENDGLLQDYQNAYRAYLAAKKELQELKLSEDEKKRRLELLDYQIDEIEAAGVRDGERAELQKQLVLMQNAERLTGLLRSAYTALNGDEQAQGAVSEALLAAEALKTAASCSEDFREAARGVGDAAYELSAFAEEVRDRLFSFEFEPAQIDAVEQRLDTLQRLSSKYGKSERNILDFLAGAQAEREKIVGSEERLAELKELLERLRTEAQEKALRLSESRQRAGRRFAERVAGELSFLEMPSVTFLVRNEQGGLTETGTDRIEFLLSANAGETPRALSRIASGGELARIMLAVKGVLAEKDGIATLIFDEIDAGISGRCALKIARKLRELSSSHQVVCVTHLAQIAAYADEHLSVEKSEAGGRTFTSVLPLDLAGRKAELARIMGGLALSETMLAGAEELLKAASEGK